MTTDQTDLSFTLEPGILSDLFNFPWLPLRSSDAASVYVDMAARGSVGRIAVLVIANSLGLFFSILLMVSGNPYIRLNSYLSYPPFLIAFVSLPAVFSFIYLAVHFLCFRAVSGKGNLTAQSYLSVLSSGNFVLLYWLAIILAYVTRSEHISTPLLVIGGIYLLIPSFKSWAAIHQISVGRFIAGFVLAVISSVPLQLLYSLSLNYLAEAKSGQGNVWIIGAIFVAPLTLAIFVLLYMHQQSKLIQNYPNSVPIVAPLKRLFQLDQ